jgi:4-hydroxy-L-threonine phosphate dehydrogenase PdxA
MRCDRCGGSIHRHDRYIVLVVRHKDCGDPRGVGQKVLNLGLKPNDGGLTPLKLRDGETLADATKRCKHTLNEDPNELDTEENTIEAHDADTASEPKAAQEVGQDRQDGNRAALWRGPDEAPTGLL